MVNSTKKHNGMFYLIYSIQCWLKQVWFNRKEANALAQWTGDIDRDLSIVQQLWWETNHIQLPAMMRGMFCSDIFLSVFFLLFCVVIVIIILFSCRSNFRKQPQDTLFNFTTLCFYSVFFFQILYNFLDFQIISVRKVIVFSQSEGFI